MGTSNLMVNALQTSLPELKFRYRSRARKNSTNLQTAPVVTVGRLLKSIQPLPARSLLLGKCEDGLPFLMEMRDPEVGATLIGCRAGYGKTHQLQVMAESAIQTNPPTSLQIAILTLNPQDWTSLSHKPDWNSYVQGIHAWYDPRAETLITSLTELAEARRQGDFHGAEVLCLLDDLDAGEDLSLGAQINLRWLIEYGAQSGVWVVATLNEHLMDHMQYWMEPFRTRITGLSSASKHARALAMRSDLPAGELSPAEFRVHTGGKWLTYTLPLLGD